MSDDLPIQSKGCYGFADEQGEQFSEIEETGPLESRIDSKNWKTRSKAYSELINELNSIGSYSSHESKLIKLLNDSNPNPQEKSLEILGLFLKHEPAFISPYLGGILKILIEKNLSGPKQSAKDSAKSLMPGLFKLDRTQTMTVLIKYLDHKTPKVVSAAVASFTVILENLSFKVLDLNLVTTHLAKSSEHTNPAIRADVLNWFKELYKQIQSGIEPFLTKLKKPQQDELQKFFTTLEVVPSNQIDCSDLLEPRDLFLKYNEKWTDAVLSLEKWKDKKEALEELNEAASYPRLVEKSASFLVSLAKRLLNDSNIHVVSQSIKLLGLLARGQKRFFEGFAKTMTPVLLLKFRDKNRAVITETHLALENFLYAVSLDQLLPFLESSLNDKTIPARLQTLSFINKVFTKASTEGIRELFLMVRANTDDSNDSVREACFKSLAVFVNAFSELKGLLTELSDGKKRKIFQIQSQMLEAGAEKENLDQEAKTSKAARPMDLDRPPDRKKELKEKNRPELPENQDKHSDFKVLKNLDPGLVAKLKDKNWKVKESAFKELKTKAESLDSTEELAEIHEIVFEALSGFKENNLNLVKAGLDCLLTVYTKTVLPVDLLQKLFNTQCLEKLTDLKSSELLKTCLMSVSEILGPNELVLKFSSYLKESPKPKVLAESCELLNLSVKEFNIQLFELRVLVEYAKSCFQHSNPTIKKSSVGLFKTIYSKIGCSIYEMLDDLKESSLRLLKDEFLNVQTETAPEIRKMRVVLKPNLVSNSKKQNISGQITSELLTHLECKDWQVKKKALEATDQLIPKKLSPSGLSDLMRVLKASLSDSNKISVKMTLEVLDKIARALDEDCIGFWRPVVNAIIFLFKDKTSNIRTAAKDSIEIWASKVGQEKMLNAMSEPLKWDSIESRSEILSFIVKNKAFLPKSDTKSLVPNILLCLQDRTISVRNQAEVVFGEIIEITGFESVQHHLECMKPAVLQSLKPVLDKYRGPIRIGANCKKVGSKYNPKYFFFIPNKKSKLEVQDWGKIPEKTIDLIKNEVKLCSSPELFELFYNPDLALRQSVPNAIEGMAENQFFSETFDIVLKWAMIEFYQNNPLSVNIAGSCVAVILGYYKDCELKPPDGELDMIIPVLAIKSAESATSPYCKPILMGCFEIYKEEKACNSLIAGLNAKNTLRAEVLNLFKEIFLSFKPNVGIKVLKFLENFAKAKDVRVADEAFDLLVSIYRTQGSSSFECIDRGVMSKILAAVKKETNPEKVSAKPNIFPGFKQEKPVEASTKGGILKSIILKLKDSDIKENFQSLSLLQENLRGCFLDMKRFSKLEQEELIDSILDFLHILFKEKAINAELFNFQTLMPEDLKNMFKILINFFAVTNILTCLDYSYLKSIYVVFIQISIEKDIFRLFEDEIVETLKILFEFTESNTMIRLLFELLTLEDTIEFMDMINKCIVKCSMILMNLHIDYSSVFVCLHETIFKITSNMAEHFSENDNRLRAIKIFLMEFVFATGEKVFEIYEDVIRSHSLKDEHIEDWLKVIFQGNYQVFLIFKKIKNGGNFEKCVHDIHALIADSSTQVSLDYFFKTDKEIAEKVDEMLQKNYGRTSSRYTFRTYN